MFGPVEEGAERALKPARDLINWFDETFQARGENEELRGQVARAAQQGRRAQGGRGREQQFAKLLELDRTGRPRQYDPVTARVIGRSPTVWYSTVTVDQGSSSGVEGNDPVITGDGLVGRITDTTARHREVTLITDHRSAVSAQGLAGRARGRGRAGGRRPSDLLLDFIDNRTRGSTRGSCWSPPAGRTAPSPRPSRTGSRSARVTSASVTRGDTYQRVQVRPFADLRGMDYVQVLTGGPARPGVPG